MHVPWKGVYTFEDDSSMALFQPGDLVWAKVQGHPWYPCEVMAPDAPGLAPIASTSGLAKVRFFDEHEENSRTW